MLSPAQRAEYSTATDQSLSHAAADLETVSKRTLNADQQSVVRQIKDFMAQAQQARETDLISARGLAQKAEVLARNLTQSLR